MVFKSKTKKYDVFKNGRRIANEVTFPPSQIVNLRKKFKKDKITIKLSK